MVVQNKEKNLKNTKKKELKRVEDLNKIIYNYTKYKYILNDIK